jgi:hypothetical protein
LPTRIVEDEYLIFKNEINKLDNDLLNFKFKYKENNPVEFLNIFEECFELDNNETPARYRLKYLNKLFPGLNQKVFILKIMAK